MMQKTCKSDEVQLSLSVNGEKQGEPFPGEDYMKRYLAAYMEHGGLFDRATAARMTGMTKQRIGVLVRENRLRLVTLRIETPKGEIVVDETIPGNDLVAWMNSPKAKGGRGKRFVPRPLEAVAA